METPLDNIKAPLNVILPDLRSFCCLFYDGIGILAAMTLIQGGGELLSFYHSLSAQYSEMLQQQGWWASEHGKPVITCVCWWNPLHKIKQNGALCNDSRPYRANHHVCLCNDANGVCCIAWFVRIYLFACMLIYLKKREYNLFIVSQC